VTDHETVNRQAIPRVRVPGPGFEHLLDEPGTMRQIWWKVCKGCRHRLEPGDISVLGETHGVWDWMCVDCAVREGIA
jgi:hypothetical protein